MLWKRLKKSIQLIVLGLVIGGSMANTIGLTLPAAPELWAAMTLFKRIKANNHS